MLFFLYYKVTKISDMVRYCGVKIQMYLISLGHAYNEHINLLTNAAKSFLMVDVHLKSAFPAYEKKAL